MSETLDFSPLLEEAGEIFAEKEVRVEPGVLYVVATPIGRLVDLSFRAVKVLEGVDLIAAEDTRRAYILLNVLGIKKKVVSNQKFNEHGKSRLFLEELKNGKSLAVISDAGTPCISDPGNELIRSCIAENVPVVPVPGPCAAVSALSVSGFDLSSFLFRGFFPKENTERKEEAALLLSGVAPSFAYYESPKRILKTLRFLAETLPQAKICLANDLTKMHERFYRGTPEEVFREVSENPNGEKGEFTLLVEMPSSLPQKKDGALSPAAALADCMIKNGASAREAIELLSDQYRKNELKDAALKLKKAFGEKE